MPTTMTPPALLADLTSRGFAVRVVDGQVAVMPASRLTPLDRVAIREARTGLLALITPGEPWNSVTAHRLMSDADTLVASLGVDGRRPAVAETATMVGSAFATGDLETLRFAVAQFTALIRKLAAERSCGGLHSVPEGV